MSISAAADMHRQPGATPAAPGAAPAVCTATPVWPHAAPGEPAMLNGGVRCWN